MINDYFCTNKLNERIYVMSAKIGDKVRFLNATGGGTVVRFKGKDQVIVEDEDGFEVPVLIHECVVVGDSSTQQRKSNSAASSYKSPAAQQQPKPEPKPEPKRPEPKVAYKETVAGERLNACIAYLPLDPKEFQQTRFEAYFVNDSNYFLYINYMSCSSGSFSTRYDGLVEPGTKIFMEEFGKDDLNDLSHIAVQFIAFKRGKPFVLKDTCSVDIHLDTVKFYKMHCFVQNDFFDDDALILPIVTNDRSERPLYVDPDELKQAMQSKIHQDNLPPTAAPTRKHDKLADAEVVDLHINQLLDTTVGMSPGEILDYQLGKFREALKNHAGEKGKKIIFIHGKGEGVLRNAILNELKTKYKTYEYQDASFLEYGYGATQVTIK